MSWSRDLPITWSWHVITHMISSHDPDTWPIKFIRTSSYHWYQHPHYYSHIMTTSRFLIRHMITTSSHHHDTHCLSSKDLVWALSMVFWRPIKKTTSRSTPVLESVGGGLIEGKCPWLLQQELDQEEVPLIAIIEAWLRRSVLNRFVKKTTGGATCEVISEDGWPDAA